MTKILTGFAAYLLKEDNLIDFNDPVSKYIEGYASLKVLIPGKSGEASDFTEKLGLKPPPFRGTFDFVYIV